MFVIVVNIHNITVTSKILGWQITVLMKIYWGDARERLCEAIDQVPLDSLTLGNRGLGPLQRCLLFQPMLRFFTFLI